MKPKQIKIPRGVFSELELMTPKQATQTIMAFGDYLFHGIEPPSLNQQQKEIFNEVIAFNKKYNRDEEKKDKNV